MTRSFHIDIEIDETKHDDVNVLGKQWIEKLVEDALDDEGIQADVFAMEVKPD